MKLNATSSAQRRGGESGAPVKEMAMDVSTEGRQATQDNVGQYTSNPGAFRLRVAAAVVGLAVLLAGGAQWSQHDAGTAQEAEAQPKAEAWLQHDAALAPEPTAQPEAAAQAAPPAIDYFPAQFVNQAKDKEVEEHIQAF